jgi:hypothetical protein
MSTRRRREWRDNRYSAAGWRDYASGQPYPRAYDTWREVDQRNYENGRMRAANYALAGKRLTPQHVLIATYLAAIEQVGAAFLNTRNAADSIPKMQHARQHA